MGKKKSKKKSSSKSKKGGGSKTNTEATVASAPSSEDFGVETASSPNCAASENVDGSNTNAPDSSIDEVSVADEAELDDSSTTPDAKDSPTSPPSETETPERTISPKGDEESSDGNVDSENAVGVSESPEVKMTPDPPSDNNDSEQGIVEQPTPETNGEAAIGHAENSSDEEAEFLDARSHETDDSKESSYLDPPVEIIDESDNEKKSESIEGSETETPLEASNDNDNASGKGDESGGAGEDVLPVENDSKQNTDGEPEDNSETKVEVIKVYGLNTGGAVGVDVQEDTGDSDNETYTTYVDDLPLFHYSRIVGSGFSKGIANEADGSSPAQRSTCSEFAVVRVDREELVTNLSNAPAASATASDFNTVSRTASSDSDALSSASVPSAVAIRKRQREQALLLSSDLWFQPHSIVASGYGGDKGGTISMTRITGGQNSGHNGRGSDSSPSVVFATQSTELGGIIDSSGHGKSNSNSYGNVTTALHLRDGDTRAKQGLSIVDMSFDASGTVLGAVDGGGHCAVWEFKYTTSLQSTSLVFGDLNKNSSGPRNAMGGTETFLTPASTPMPTRPQVSPASQAATPAPGIFSNFMSKLTGVPPPEEGIGGGSSHGGATDADNTNNSAHGSVSGAAAAMPASNSVLSSQPSQPPVLIPALTAEISNQSRINYPAKWGPPTCMAIDPAYKQKRDKSIVVGFENGQLYLTKKGTFFQRRNDTILYQAGNRGDSSYKGIETVVWRGPLVAFADAAGIKLIDSDHLTRIAQINRPAGASAFLYPSIREISPSLFFETAQHLLVGWGDCLMQIYVEEHEDDASSSALSAIGSHETGSSSKEPKIRRTAACTMAWELDCVACDIVPLDGDHVVVLGLVSLADGEDGIGVDDGTGSPSHDLEMQVVSRQDGTISYSDSLPLIEGAIGTADPYSSPIESRLSVRDFRLLSSFALPRMQQADETKALRDLVGADETGNVGVDVRFDINQPLFPGTNSSNNGIEFRDPHLEWNIKSIMYGEDAEDETELFGSSEDDGSSVDSDDYECILRPIETIQPLSSNSTGTSDHSALPPTMVVCTESDAILSLTSTVDDAVEYSLENQKCALALSRGLRHKRQLRRYNLDDLINYYLEAVLRIPAAKPESSLSLRRMQLAVKAMPVLLGDRTELWDRWTKELENIPGSLFLLRKYLPVRDPILPSTIYIRILERMLSEVEHLSQALKKDDPSSIEIHAQAMNHFLESLIAWGPTKVLKEYISFYKFNKQSQKGKKNVDNGIRSTEISLQRRYLQTAAGYLIFPVRDIEEELQVSAPRYEVHNVDTEDSLFDISKAVALVAARVPLVASPEDFGESGEEEAESSYALAPNNHTCLEAMARLRMMQGEFDLALKCFLAIGACHATDAIKTFEEAAIQFIIGETTALESSHTPIGNHSYEFVMNLIERHELNQFLFEKDFLLSTDSKLFMPVFALIRLVGLRRVGNFLMEHCVAAGFTYSTTLSEMNAFSFSEEDSMDEPKGILRRGSLPIDKVAEQLENSPAILHWYLHLVFTRRADFYVNFPTNSVLPKAVSSLHQKHFKLYMDFAGDTRDSSKVLAGVEAYKAESQTTPLLTFLKATLPLGGVIPVDARRALEIERRKDIEDDDDKDVSSSPVFALELAYIIEKFSDETETEALGILNLYLKGAKSLPLAVSYAQRQTKFTAALWDHLISHCLKQASDGTIYGELLEAAALKGADLARLVERIPPGMVVEGLRPRLVAAVADYRMKLEIYEAAIAAGSEEKVGLMREIGHRVRRGLRYDAGSRKASFAELIAEKVRKDEASNMMAGSGIGDEPESHILTKTRLRRDRKRLVYSIPRR